MSKVVASGAMSVDGYVASPADPGYEHLFAWYDNGPMTIPTAKPELTFHMTTESAQLWNAFVKDLGALIVGRRTFDITNGWEGRHPLDVPVVVMTHQPPEPWIAEHPDAPFTFVTDGIEHAVTAARASAADKDVGVTAGIIAQQALDAGVLDELWVMLVPVLLGSGRPFFEEIGTAPVSLDDPLVVVARGVTHLRYPVRRDR